MAKNLKADGSFVKSVRSLRKQVESLQASLDSVLSEVERITPKTPLDSFEHNPKQATLNPPNACSKRIIPGRMDENLTIGYPNTRPLLMPTPRSRVVAGAWLKWLVYKSLVAIGRNPAGEFPKSDREIVECIARECDFVGPIGFRGNPENGESTDALDWAHGQSLADMENGDELIRCVLDESQSFKIEAIPVELDDMLFHAPMTEGELFPFVSFSSFGKNWPESLGGVTIHIDWPGAPGPTELPEETKSEAISRILCYPLTCAAKVGLSGFLEQDNESTGQFVTRHFSRSLRVALDDVIAYGDGKKQPLGIFNDPSVSVVLSFGGPGASPQAEDYENLHSSISRWYGDRQSDRFAYIGTDTSYKRARQIPVESGTYSILGRPFLVPGTRGVNSQIAGAILNKYMLDRRLGVEVRAVPNSEDLTRHNEFLLVVRMWIKGQLSHGTAAARIDDAQP